MSESMFKEMLAVAEHGARLAGVALIGKNPVVIASAGKDVKVDVDLEVHERILEFLSTTRIPVLSEEDKDHTIAAGLQWVVDPLDGSLNFLRGIPNCAISIALMEDSIPILGAVYDFNRDEMFSGMVGHGATMNGTRLTTSSVTEKAHAVLMSGFPSYTEYSTKALQEYISSVQSYKKVRLIGSAALSLAYVASGRADSYYEKDIKIWDVAAGLALVESAGGKYSMSTIDERGGCEVFAWNGRKELNYSYGKR